MAKNQYRQSPMFSQKLSVLSLLSFFWVRWKIEQVYVILTNHALVMAVMESGLVLPEAKKMLLVLDEGHHIADVARDTLEVEANITLPYLTAQLDNFVRHV